MRSKDISQALSDLISSGNVDSDPTYMVPGFKVSDIYPIFKHRFNEKALKTLENRTHNQIYEYNDEIPAGKSLVILGKLGLKSCKKFTNGDALYTRKIDCVRFIASRTTKDKLHTAVEKVIATVNHLADKGFTKASLMQLGVLEIMPIDRPEKEFIVLSYITLTEKGYKYVQNQLPNMFVEEAGIPKRIEDQ